ncbi:MAG: FG-GAP repeat domain-containing protein [Thermoguttaceae bacterium]
MTRPSLPFRTGAAGVVAMALVLIATAASAAERRYYAAQCAQVSGTAWGISDRDGAGRATEPYLSSLVGGEQQIGAIGSPPFKLSGEVIRFTIRGHDGMRGGRNKNFAALIDNKTGDILQKMPAPGTDDLQERQWDVAALKGRTVRFQVVDGVADGAYAWLGIGKIEAGPELTVDFRQGLPKGWAMAEPETDQSARRFEDIKDGPVPFRTFQDAFTWVPESGASRVDIGCEVERVFLLGCTVPGGHVLRPYGTVDLVYDDKTKESFPLIYGFNLESPYKTATRSDAACVRPIGDGTRSLVAIEPKQAARLVRIELSRAADLPRPRIAAITCQVSAAVEVPKSLVPLEPVAASAEAERWLASHTLSAAGPSVLERANEIRRAHGVPVTLEEIGRLEEPAGARFSRTKLADRRYEAASVCDVDGDGTKDIVSGDYWYAGPDFKASFRFRTLLEESGYHDSFHDYPMDVNGDGRPDIVSGGWFGQTLSWRENPAGARSAGEWAEHEIDKPGRIETSRFWDVDGDGQVEIVPNAAGNVVFYRLVRDGSAKGTGKFDKHAARMGGCGHGLGFGDVNGDGRNDFVTPTGWLEAPEKPLEGEWAAHDNEFNLPHASVPILVHDVNEDGLADLVYGNGHGYGIYWIQQTRDAEGKRGWIKHTIDDSASQYHDMLLADIDGDRKAELVTGKRYYAHNGKDPGAEDPVFVRYFDFDKSGVFKAHTIDYGKAGEASGAGIYFWVEDLNGDGRPDIVAPGKDGLFLFINEGK